MAMIRKLYRSQMNGSVCNGSNCSETPLTTVVPPVVAATEHDVPPKPLDTLALFNSISVPQLKAGNTIVV
jgi:hypothetical protein